MKFNKIPIFFYPTTIVFVDDNSNFLKLTRLSLVDKVSCYAYNNPNEALQFIVSKHEKINSILASYTTDSEEVLDKIGINIDIKFLYKEIFNPKRFSLISILITDHAMPGMTGIELCKSLRDYNIQKIMLTGKMNAPDAIQAFNDGHIDKFISKLNDDASDVLITTIYELLQRPFNDFTSLIVTNKNSELMLNEILSNKEIIIEFNKIYESYQIAEHYLLDEDGSFFLLSNDGKPFLFLIRTEEYINTLYDHAKIEKLPENILGSLKNKQAIPCTQSVKDLVGAPEQWENIMFPLSKVVSNKTFYCCVIPVTKASESQASNIFSFKDYLNIL